MATKTAKKKALTIAQMRELANQKGIEGADKMSKTELKNVLSETPAKVEKEETVDLPGEH